jgi:hypothetical protein
MVSRGDASDELYGLPLADFTRVRDELARNLRREGRRKDAETVKALRKPTLTAWTLNQLARRRPKDIERLLATGRRLREAQEALLAGGDRSALKDATAEERELVAKLTRDATAVAGEVGRSASGPLEERIHATLHAAALDEQTAAELAAGRLVREQEAVGLFGAGSVEVGASGRSASPDRRARPAVKPAGARTGTATSASRRRDAGKRREKLQQELAAARARELSAQRERAGAAKATDRTRRQAEQAERRAGEARNQAEEARARLREAERREGQAAREYDRAARAVASARKKLE